MVPGVETNELDEDPIGAGPGVAEEDPIFPEEELKEELLPIVHVAGPEALIELEEEPIGAGVFRFANDDEDDIYLFMPHIPYTRHTRRPMEKGV